MTFTIDYDPREAASGLLDSLNAPQRDAVEQTEGPLLVLAGAGTGKTRVLATRLAYLLDTNRAVEWQIIAVTFTNKAAKEMNQRVDSLVKPRLIPWLGTFHSLAARMLRSHAPLVGLSSNFTILDADDQVRLVKQLMTERNIDTKKSPPQAVSDIINGWKDKAKTPSDVHPDEVSDFANGKLLEIYGDYQSRMKTLNACDFGDLLLHVITILKNPENKHIVDGYHHQFKYILVDEYQDTNVAQYLWLRLLAKGSNNICCVGDDDQSIYGWRGAEIDNILRFEKDFPGAKIIRLEENYRSTGHILAAANGVISHNNTRLGKELYTQAGDGEKISVRGLWDGPAEARWIGEEIENLQRKKNSLNEIAVLVRTGFQMREFEERFMQLNLPYRVIGGPRFYERKEIRDALAYLRVIAQSHDNLALERIINVPKRGLGNSTLQILHTYARSKNISLYQSILDLTQTDELKPKVRSTLMKLIDDFERWKSLVSTVHHAELAATVLDESGYNEMWKADKSPDSPGRLENLKELISAMDEFESLATFLEHIALVLDNQDNNSGEFITLMTLHAAKGLEFDYVFLAGWEEGLFPSKRSMDENGMKGLEEERRLAYVGITRAKLKSYVSYVANRRMYGSWVNPVPSCFVSELPKDHIESQVEMGLYDPGRSSHWDSSGFSSERTQKIFARTVDEKRTFDGLFTTGDRVFHEKFGNGTVIHIEGQKLDVQFDHAGHKRVMDSFVSKG
ncbi:MAG: UvrD-helicase domain-containing protein [Alphaproteobacteria bacterium]|nr:UvrD-helicase domain-containing protein [Alphaproteobacteria bacterium]